METWVNHSSMDLVKMQKRERTLKRKGLIKQKCGGILRDQVWDSNSSIATSVLARSRSIWSEVEHWMQCLKERKELRTKIHPQVLDKETGGESSTTLHFLIEIGKRCVEESTQ